MIPLPRIVPSHVTELRRQMAQLQQQLAKIERKTFRIECPRIGAIVEQVAAETGIPAAMIYGSTRRAPEAKARQRVYWLARQQGFSLTYIGRVMFRDHSTVLSGIRAEEGRMKQ